MKYAVLLRGVNVGGTHRVPNGEFREELETLGFRDVVTYINSGNAIITSETKPNAAAVRSALERRFGFSIPTLIISAEQIQAIAAAIPDDWTNDPPKLDKSGQKSDVLYLFEEVDNVRILQRLGYKPEFETMIYLDGAVLANISRNNQSRYSLLKIVGTPLYAQMTVRNIVTAKKLAELTK